MARINDSWVLIVGAGLGGTYVAYDLARKGYNLKICDGDRVELANLGAQKHEEKDLDENKAIASAKRSAERTSLPMEAIGIPYMLSEAVDMGVDLSAEVAVAFTDSFLSRFEVSEHFYERSPAVFAGLGEGGTWGWTFLQRPGGPCLRCCLPDVDPYGSGSCTGLAVDSAKLTSSLVTYGVDTLVLDHKYRKRNWNYRKIDLSGYSASADEIRRVEKNPGCELCGQFGD